MSDAHPAPRPTPSVVTPGNHDGVHLGHRALVTAARARAEQAGIRTMAMFFDPHPTQILAPERAPVLLTAPGRRAKLLEAAGADAVAVLPFDAEFARTPPEVFVEKVLLEVCAARGVVVGPDFHFGHRRSGNVETLRALGERHGFEVEVVEPVLFQGEPVSSTRIRALLQAGDVVTVQPMLTRLHDVDGVVVPGDRRGRTIGFPTANLACQPTQLPGDGVYAVVVRRLDRTDAPLLDGVANLGVRPTLAAGRSVEVHVLDFDRDLYDVPLRVGFVRRLREERRFSGLDALKDQIARDVDLAREALASFDRGLAAWM